MGTETRVTTVYVEQGDYHYPVIGELTVKQATPGGKGYRYKGDFTWLEYNQDCYLSFDTGEDFRTSDTPLKDLVDGFLQLEPEFPEYSFESYGVSFADWSMDDRELEYQLKRTYNHNPNSLYYLRDYTCQRMGEIVNRLYLQAMELATREAYQRAAKAAADWWTSKIGTVAKQSRTPIVEQSKVEKFRELLEESIYQELCSYSDTLLPGFIMCTYYEPDDFLSKVICLVDDIEEIRLPIKATMWATPWGIQVREGGYRAEQEYIYKQQLFDVQ